MRLALAQLNPTVGDLDGNARLIAEAAENYAPFAEMGRNGQRLVHAHLLLPDILERYADMVEAAATDRIREVPAWEPFAEPA